MATKPINVDAYEIKTLIVDKCAQVVTYLTSASHPALIDSDAVADAIKRASELNLALKEAIAAMPKATQSGTTQRANAN